MRYLKTYESFDDNRPSNQTKLIDDVEDIFLDLSDNGFEVDLSIMNYTPPMLDDSLKSLVVDLVPLQMEFFRWSDIKDTIERLEEYCFRKDEGYGIDVEVDDDYMHIDRFIDVYGREELNRIHLYIYSEDDYGDLLNQKDMNESIYMDYDSQDDVRDILSDITDDGIEIKTNIREDGRIIISIGDELADLDMLSIDVEKYEDSLLRAIEYIKSKGYRFTVFSYDDRGIMRIVRDSETNANINGEQFKIELTTMLINNTPPTNYLRLFFKKQEIWIQNKTVKK